MFVTLQQANDHLRADLENDGGSPPIFTDDRVPDIALKIIQAEAIITDYLKVDADLLEGSPPLWQSASPLLWTTRDMSVIQASVLLLLSALYDDEMNRTVEDYLKPDGTVALLLARLRDPAIA